MFPALPDERFGKRKGLFSLLQVVFFLAVFVGENTKYIEILFPVMTLLCIPARISWYPRSLKGGTLLVGLVRPLNQRVDCSQGGFTSQ
jgi:hypothetical protein